MQVVILAGGKGTRLSEESLERPKPMVEIGGIPVLVHIMRYFSSYGHHDFIICAGYRSRMIKEFFLHYHAWMNDATFDLRSGGAVWHQTRLAADPWRVTVADTGFGTMTGGRLRRIRPYLQGGPFFMTYGDGLADVDLAGLEREYRKSGLPAAVTVVQPPGRFGHFALNGSRITGFAEKPAGDGGWINGGFFILVPEILDRIKGDDTAWEEAPLQSLAAEGRIMPWFHDGFWQPMDTLRDKMLLESIWESGDAPWKRERGNGAAV